MDEYDNYNNPNGLIEEALALLDRQKPLFVAKRTARPLTTFNEDYARALRDTGMGVKEIAKTLNSCVATVSRVCR